MAEEDTGLEIVNVAADPQISAPTGEGEIPGTGAPGEGKPPEGGASPAPADEKDNLQKRFDEITADKWSLSREVQERNERISSLERKLADQGRGSTPTVAAVTGVPQRDSYDTDEAYVDALTDYKLDQKIAALRADEEVSIAQEERDEVQVGLKKRLHEGNAKHADFAQKAFNTPFNYTPTMLDVMAALEDPAEVAYFLGQQENHNLGHELELLRDPVSVATKLGQISQMAKAATVAKPEPNAVTGTPAPLEAVSGGGGNATGYTVDSLAKLEQADFNRTVRSMRVAKGII